MGGMSCRKSHFPISESANHSCLGKGMGEGAKRYESVWRSKQLWKMKGSSLEEEQTER